MKIKSGVRVLGVKSELLFAIQVAEWIYKEQGFELVVTSIVDGQHSRASKHYSGLAFDCRTSHLTEVSKPAIVTNLKESLGNDFDVILESDHIHVEYDPKEAL